MSLHQLHTGSAASHDLYELLQRMMSASGQDPKALNGVFELESEWTQSSWESRYIRFSFLTPKATGNEVVIYEIAGELKRQNKILAVNQTLCSFIDAEYDEPLLMASSAAWLVREFSDDLDLWESPSYIDTIGHRSLGFFASSPYFSAVPSVRGLVFGYMLEQSLAAGNFQLAHVGRLRRVVRIPVEHRIPVKRQSPHKPVKNEVLDVEPGLFDLMAQAEAKAEALVQEEIDEARSAYTLVSDDEY
jgi:hypothetical protein